MKAEFFLGIATSLIVNDGKGAPVFELALLNAVFLIGLRVGSRSLWRLNLACSLLKARLMPLMCHLARALQASRLFHFTIGVQS